MAGASTKVKEAPQDTGPPEEAVEMAKKQQVDGEGDVA